MTVLITRPREDAKKIAKAIEKVGAKTLVEPMLKIQPMKLQGELFHAGGYVFTSKKGVKNAPKDMDMMLPVFAVGAKTAQAARDKGFWSVATANGNVESLLRMIKTVWRPSKGDLLHFSGRHVRGDLKGELAKDGITLYGVPVYEAKAAENLSADVKKALKDKKITHALFYSVRTITTFQSNVKKEKLEKACKGIKIYCLSKSIANAAEEFGWKSVTVTNDPTEMVLKDLSKEPA